MKNKQVLLSICIPTYNRSIYLEETLKNICLDQSFDERVEIIISDNASTDNTQSIGINYSLKYSNIHYYRNEENINDKNFMLALSRGKGKYVRLFNDTLRFQEGALKNILDVISNSSEDTPLFFYQNISFLKNNNSIKDIKTKNDFINETSYWVTWIANFGNWKSFIDKIIDPYRFSPMQLAQVDWTYQIIYNNEVKICFGNFVDSVPVKNKGGYNIYKVFISNYLSILRFHSVSELSINTEKKRLLKHFIHPWNIRMIKDKSLTFMDDDKWSILFKEYKNMSIFYSLSFLWLAIQFIEIIKAKIRMLKSKNKK